MARPFCPQQVRDLLTMLQSTDDLASVAEDRLEDLCDLIVEIERVLRSPETRLAFTPSAWTELVSACAALAHVVGDLAKAFLARRMASGATIAVEEPERDMESVQRDAQLISRFLIASFPTLDRFDASIRRNGPRCTLQVVYSSSGSGNVARLFSSPVAWPYGKRDVLAAFCGLETLLRDESLAGPGAVAK